MGCDEDKREGRRPKGKRPIGPRIGILEWIRLGEREHTEHVLQDLKALGVTELRTGISWADWYRPEGRSWYQWLLPRIAQEVNLLPCFLYTPPSMAIAPKTSAPPRDLKAYADFLDVFINEFGEYFEWVELWNEPNNPLEWDWMLDPGWRAFAEMIGNAAYWARHLGKKTVLGGMSPIDAEWLAMMADYGVIAHIDAVGLHGFPGTWDYVWEGWPAQVERVREALDRYGLSPEIWITETGYSTWQHDQKGQMRAFIDAVEAPVDRVYWYGAHDLDPELAAASGFHLDEREYHFGLKYLDGRPKPLYQFWARGGIEAVDHAVWLGEVSRREAQERRPVLITGGAGFIGTNLAAHLLEQDRPVLLYDNLSRPGVERNVRWLRDTYGDMVQVEIADVRDKFALRRAVRCSEMVFHLAAQVAVTKSITNPLHDFEVNLNGTLNLLEELRGCENPPPLIFTSTNKVYGTLDDLPLGVDRTRYECLDGNVADCGISEGQPLDFHSPYGCSKGAADQYVLDYVRSFGLQAVVFRMSCIYGPHQYGTEDQGWVAHLALRALDHKPITIYGDGLQVRDVLYVDDLIDAFMRVESRIADLAGEVFNVGGGPRNTISLLELIDLMTEHWGERPVLRFEDWRMGDQRYYVSNVGKIAAAISWEPRTRVAEGTRLLFEWLEQSRHKGEELHVPSEISAQGRRA
ncbi:MAG: NAD-dependent epimerase/dehydratase family protein [Anaerolineae bacterium]